MHAHTHAHPNSPWDKVISCPPSLRSAQTKTGASSLKPDTPLGRYCCGAEKKLHVSRDTKKLSGTRTERAEKVPNYKQKSDWIGCICICKYNIFIHFTVNVMSLPTVTHSKELRRGKMTSNCSGINAVRRSCANVISLFMCLNCPHKQEK